jgi:O-antigen ligase
MSEALGPANIIGLRRMQAHEGGTYVGGNFVAFSVGIAVFTASPPELTAQFLRVPFLHSYIVTYFDGAVALGCLLMALNGALRFSPSERRLWVAIGLVILIRAVSLAFATDFVLEQVVSVLRYVETGAVLLLLANLLSISQHRRVFLKAIFLGAVLDSVGGVFRFAFTAGEQRGIWLGVDTYKLLVFFLLVCCLSLSKARHKSWGILWALFLVVSILVNGTRAAVVLFVLSSALLFWTRRRAAVKSAAAVALLGAVGLVPVLSLFPQGRQVIEGRASQVLTGGGTIGLRFILWRMAAAAYLAHPVIGIGSGGFARQQDALYLQINEAYDPQYETLYEGLSTHNTVLGIAAETGTLGLIAYLVWVTAVVAICIRGIRLEALHYDTYVLAACVCLLAMMAEDWWGQASFIPTSTSILGFILGWSRAHALAMRTASAR